jgi:hypothetical protein
MLSMEMISIEIGILAVSVVVGVFFGRVIAIAFNQRDGLTAQLMKSRTSSYCESIIHTRRILVDFLSCFVKIELQTKK